MSAEVATPTGQKPFLNPFEESQDHGYFELFHSLHGFWHQIKLPSIFGYQITKFELLIAAAALIVFASLMFLARRMRDGGSPRGIFQNLLETIVYFVRDQIARPAIGEKEGDQYVPYLATTFLFILVANLFGMIPFMGSPTASIAVTAALALISFIVTHAAGIQEYGLFGYMRTFVPHIELDGPAKVMGIFLIPLILFLELLTPFIRAFVLSVRLFANMLAGHTALFMLMYFIRMASHPDWVAYTKGPTAIYYAVVPFSILLVTALSILELLVAVLQAFIFTLLTAIFIGLAKHPAH